MSAKSTRRRRDRRTRRSRTSRPSDASPRGDPHSPTAQHRLDAALATLQITPARRTVARGRRGSAGSSTGGRSSRPPRPTSPSTCRSARYIGPATLDAISGYLAVSGHAAGPLFRRVLRGGHGSSEPLGADGIRGGVRKRVAAVPGSGGRVGGHSFRVGSAQRAWQSCSRPGGWRSPDTPEVYIRLKAARGPVARGAATGWAGSNTLYRAGLPAIGSGKVPTRMYRSPLPG